MFNNKTSLVEFHDIDVFTKRLYNKISVFHDLVDVFVIITFVGHGSLYNCDDLSEKVRKAIIDNTQSEDNIIFYCGAYKSFCYAKRKKKYVINLA